VESRPLDLTFLVLTLSSPEHLALAEPTCAPEGCSKEYYAGYRPKDARPLDLGPLSIDQSLSAVSITLFLSNPTTYP
jgi:hypothetical protein